MGRTYRYRIIYLLAIMAATTGGVCSAQETSPIVDTLTAAYKEAYRGVKVQADRTISKIENIRKVITPIGEGDAIKFIQTLPGISTGAEGSSAIYARGGNLGNNLMSIDGVTIYGISHLLGMTSSISSDAIDEMDFQIGGFDADRGSTLSSFIGLKSALPKMDKWHVSGMVSPFLENATVEGPVTKRTGIIVTGRYSPASLLYNAAKGLVSSEKGLQDFSANVYDFYAKINHRTKHGYELTASAFKSNDDYDIAYGANSDGYKLGWSNTLGMFRFIMPYTEKLRSEYGISYNVFESNQSSDVMFNGALNELKIRSSIREFTADAKLIYQGKRNSVRLGGQMLFDAFNPGATSSVASQWANQKVYGYNTVLWGQYEYRKPDVLYLKAAARLNFYRSGDNGLLWYDTSERVPEMSVMAEYNIVRNIKLVATLDHAVQFNHTLEGLPLGWSMDLVVPSDETVPHESANQGYLGMAGSFGKHRITAGGYYKTMDNLVYYSNAVAIFNGSVTGWKDNIEIGEGSSYGLETLYEYSGNRLSARVAYTLSKTDRTFANLNHGEPFPAKFDRRHILNASAEYDFEKKGRAQQGVTSAFTFQSGHWESFRQFSYPSIMPDQEEFLIPYFGEAVNNLKMRDYIRLDVGYFRNWESASGKLKYRLQAGVYNLLNRHNPFLVMYDDDSKQWMELSLVPIMPNFSFRIEF